MEGIPFSNTAQELCSRSSLPRPGDSHNGVNIHGKRGQELQESVCHQGKSYSAENSNSHVQLQHQHSKQFRIHSSIGYSQMFGTMPALHFHFPTFSGSYSQQCTYSTNGGLDLSITTSPFTVVAQRAMKQRVLTRGKFCKEDLYFYNSNPASQHGYVLEVGWNADAAVVARYIIGYILHQQYPSCTMNLVRMIKTTVPTYLGFLAMFKHDQWSLHIPSRRFTRGVTRQNDLKTIIIPTGYLTHVAHAFQTKFPSLFLHTVHPGTESIAPLRHSKLQYVISLVTNRISVISTDTPKCIDGVLFDNIPRQANAVVKYGPYHIVLNDPNLFYSTKDLIDVTSSRIQYEHYALSNVKLSLPQLLHTEEKISLSTFINKSIDKEIVNQSPYDLRGMRVAQEQGHTPIHTVQMNSGPRVYIRVNTHTRKVTVSRQCVSDYVTIYSGLAIQQSEGKQGKYIISCYLSEITDGTVLQHVEVQLPCGTYTSLRAILSIEQKEQRTAWYIVCSTSNHTIIQSKEQLDKCPYTKEVSTMSVNTAIWLNGCTIAACMQSDSNNDNNDNHQEEEIQHKLKILVNLITPVTQLGCTQSDLHTNFTKIEAITQDIGKDLVFLPCSAQLQVDMQTHALRYILEKNLPKGEEGILMLQSNKRICAAFPRILDCAELPTISFHKQHVCGVLQSRLQHIDPVILRAQLFIQPLATDTPLQEYSRFHSKLYQYQGSPQTLAKKALTYIPENTRYTRVFKRKKQTLLSHISKTVHTFLCRFPKCLLMNPQAQSLLPPFSQAQLSSLFFCNFSNKHNFHFALKDGKHQHQQHVAGKITEAPKFTARKSKEHKTLQNRLLSLCQMSARMYSSARKAVSGSA